MKNFLKIGKNEEKIDNKTEIVEIGLLKFFSNELFSDCKYNESSK